MPSERGDENCEWLQGTECGVLLEGCSDLQPGDVLQCITIELKPQAVEDVVAASI